jgi:iron complex transport system substrate-binding protein
VKRIVSLLPGATESCFALGLGDWVVGVSHECDFPIEARQRPVLTRPRLDASAPSGEINRAVARAMTDGLSLYEIDAARLRELRPDIVITQDLCAVCAVSLDDVRSALARAAGPGCELVALSPMTLEDTFEDLERIAGAAGRPERGQALAAELRARAVAALARPAARRPRVLALEWLDPPMVAGHWTPELLRLAGAEPVLGHDGGATHAISWGDVAAAEADVLLVIPCGFTVAQSERELPALLARPEVAGLRAVRDGRVLVMDGNAYWNRPGPRLLEGAELLAARLRG